MALMDGEIQVFGTDKFELVQKISVDRLVEGISDLVTHLRLYDDSHVVMQTFDATVSVVNYHDGKVVSQRLEENLKMALDNDLLIEDRNIVFSRRNRVVLLKRTVDSFE